ncbi:MAG: hypothetical protein ACW99Q_19120, partial [Candidatus Kariarchaeaceae archaeon]
MILKNEGKSEREAEDLSLLYRRILISSGEFMQKLLSSGEDLIELLDKQEEISERVMIRELVNNGLEDDNAHKLYNLTKINGSPVEFVKALRDLNLPP